MTFSLDGRPVLAGSIRFPLRGLWTADLELARVETIPATVTLEDGSRSWAGRVVSYGPSAARTLVRVAGGQADLSQALPPAFFRSVTVRTLLGFWSEASGQAVDPESEGLGVLLPFWHFQGTAGVELEMLASRIGLGWRVTQAGEIRLGSESWPASGAVKILAEDPASRVLEAVAESVPVLPGESLDGRHVDRVEIDPKARRARVSWID